LIKNNEKYEFQRFFPDQLNSIKTKLVKQRLSKN